MIRCPKRQIEEHDHVIQISSRRRILGLREGKFCLSQDEIDLAEKRCREVWAREGSEFEGRHIPIKAYFEHLPGEGLPFSAFHCRQGSQDSPDLIYDKSASLPLLYRDHSHPAHASV